MVHLVAASSRLDALFRRNVPRSTDHTIGVQRKMQATDLQTAKCARERLMGDFDEQYRLPVQIGKLGHEIHFRLCRTGWFNR
jgi:hypothetical protein